MKKLILLSAFVLLLSFTVNAQFETGQKIITGGFSIANNDLESSNTTSNPSNSNFNFSLNASVGKFINLHHAAGFTIGYSNSTQNSSANYNSLKQNNFALNYFSTYYKPFTKNFYGWLSWNAGVNYTHADYSSYLETSNGFGIGANLVPGLTYKVSKKILFNASLNNLLSLSYLHRKTISSNTNPTTTENNFSLSSSLTNTNLGNISLGFSILLNKK